MRVIDKTVFKKELAFRKTLDTKGGDYIRSGFTAHFAKRVKELRHKKGLTQEQVAYLAGLDDAYFGHLEIGRYHVSLFLAWKIANALGVSLDELTNFTP